LTTARTASGNPTVKGMTTTTNGTSQRFAPTVRATLTLHAKSDAHVVIAPIAIGVAVRYPRDKATAMHEPARISPDEELEIRTGLGSPIRVDSWRRYGALVSVPSISAIRGEYPVIAMSLHDPPPSRGPRRRGPGGRPPLVRDEPPGTPRATHPSDPARSASCSRASPVDSVLRKSM
jgi:hypothetical protein